ncbi:M48 family metallopeptidase [Tepidibacter thalassicus]|uniref:Zn-dependent protease with chaperone function n=1 Tax=Tepidibacter thalassicus DSM 15285 TaxID=1123350 RepID=A0A1M5R0Y6_9FIRM|nr:M48 family metalloprotease [Tepidibacter thalassicus]SHH19766.1 Zn-dependent protease with chaperone function [Tepidibacter thalassicus DSM 15285]
MKKFNNFKFYLVIFILITVYSSIILFVTIKKPDIYTVLFLYSILYIVIIFIKNYIPLISAQACKLQTITEGHLFNMVQEILLSVNIQKSKVKLFIRPRTKNPKMNASVQGFSKYTIILDEELIDELETEELKAIIYHEFYHIIKKHDLKRSIIMIILGLLPIACIAGFKLFQIDINENLSLKITICIYILSAILGFLRYIRNQEIEADMFVIKSIKNSENLINALKKITIKNKLKTDMHKIRKLLTTHPCLNDRINYIKENLNFHTNIL